MLVKISDKFARPRPHPHFLTYCYVPFVVCCFKNIIKLNLRALSSIAENYRSALKDAIIARKFKPDHMKAIVRGTNF